MRLQKIKVLMLLLFSAAAFVACGQNITPDGTTLVRVYKGNDIGFATISSINGLVTVANVTDGDKGEITVASGVWTIDAGAVTETKLSTVATGGVVGSAGYVPHITYTTKGRVLSIDSTKIRIDSTNVIDNGLHLEDIAASGATTTGQVPKWNATSGKWEPGSDNTGSGVAGSGNLNALTYWVDSDEIADIPNTSVDDGNGDVAIGAITIHTADKVIPALDLGGTFANYPGGLSASDTIEALARSWYFNTTAGGFTAYLPDPQYNLEFVLINQGESNSVTIDPVGGDSICWDGKCALTYTLAPKNTITVYSVDDNRWYVHGEGEPFPKTEITTDTISTTSTSFTDITELAVTGLKSGKRYKIKACIVYKGQTTGIGIGIQCNGGTATGPFTALVETTNSSAGGWGPGNLWNLSDNVVFTGCRTASGRTLVRIEAVFQCTGDGTFIPQYSSEIADNTVTVYENSYITVEEIP